MIIFSKRVELHEVDIHIKETYDLKSAGETTLVHVHLSGVEGREAFCMYTTAWVFRGFYGHIAFKIIQPKYNFYKREH